MMTPSLLFQGESGPLGIDDKMTIAKTRCRLTLIPVLLALTSFISSVFGADETLVQLDGRFASTIHPFLQTYCVSCHGKDKAEAELDLTTYSSMATVVKDDRRWELVPERLNSEEMPPKNAKLFPSADARRQAIDWFEAVRNYEIHRNAGDPGIVLARRLSNVEYNYTIRDLIGVDIRPTLEFPVDPANTAGFDNSGESLAMSPTLLKKYLKAARDVASYMYLKQSGIAFAPRPMLSETDRDKFCELQIVNLYHRYSTDYADYFHSAWRFKHRAKLGMPDATLTDVRPDSKVSPKYLSTIWSILEETKEDVGPVARLQSMWRELPEPVGEKESENARSGCEQMRDYVVQLRKKIEPRFGGLSGRGGQALAYWLNRQYATHRMTYDPAQLQVQGETVPSQQDAIPNGRGGGRGGGGRGGLISNIPGDPDLVIPAGHRAQYEASFAKFCSVFPDRFYTQQRGTNYFNEGRETGRLLSAGFLNRMGYFRDDIPLYELVLDDKQQKELDEMWRDLDFIASVTRRSYLQSFDPGSGQARAILGDGNASPDEALVSEANIKKYADGILAGAGGNEVVVKAIEDHYKTINDSIRWTEKARINAQPSHLAALQDFAARAYRRPLLQEDRDDLLTHYRLAREKDHLDHESAIRDTIVYVLMAPDLTYRIDLVEAEQGIHPLSDYDLASRLSYFLWASMPDEELLARAAAKDLHNPNVIASQARRMLKDPRMRGMAVEFGGNWLEVRRFEDINTVDRERFASFTNELRDAMFEEPIRFFSDVIQSDRSVLDFLYAKDTFVNPVLAKHYGMPDLSGGTKDWVRIEEAHKFDRGGLLPMAAFLTKNAPGLRTSPVKRGNWMVKNILGERIAPPPVGVPELPRDESKLDLPLREMLARHREDPNCAACHARFDSLGLVFEGFGPIGERRAKDLAGRPVDTHATFPGGSEGAGMDGLRQYIRDYRQRDFIDNLCGKFLAYALGRSLIPSDRELIEGMHNKLAANGYRFDTIVESIVTSPQFLNKRGREGLVER